VALTLWLDRLALKKGSVSRFLIATGGVVALFLAMDNLRLLGSGQLLGQWIRLETHYFFALLGVLLPLGFLRYPTYRIVDYLLAAVSSGVCVYFFMNAERVVDEAWEFGAPDTAVWMSLSLWAILLEGVRRAAGWGLFFIAGVFSILPVFAESMPGPLAGLSSSWSDTAAYHALSIESIFGLPFRAFASLVIGFLLFGVALQKTGGGRFFLDLAFALLGRVRGGPAKVAIVSSGLMGSMSGSVVTNVLTTGQMTIPAMKKTGISATYAAGVEACASTGGVLLPPVMGSTAFVMATFLGLPYYQVALAAALPAILYFTGLFLQVDAYAGANSLKGVAEEDLPQLGKTLSGGWFYLLAFGSLIFLLLVLQREAVAPYIATGILLILNQFSRRDRWGLREFGDFLIANGYLLVELLVVLAGVGLIVGALSVTGLSGTLVNDLLFLAGDSTGLLLIMGAVTSFVLGIGMTVTAAYIFLAVILAPALVNAGLEPISVHLFILYWAMLSFITPPVALGAFAAASIAGSNSMKTGVTAMQLGSVIYFIPFIFVLDPAFVGVGSALDTVRVTVEAVIGIWLIAGAIQGYLPVFAGFLTPGSRTCLGLGGLLIALPGIGTVSNLQQGVAGALIIAVGMFVYWRNSRGETIGNRRSN
jgi:TRAP transporter 4TM/12TM fusion protein